MIYLELTNIIGPHGEQITAANPKYDLATEEEKQQKITPKYRGHVAINTNRGPMPFDFEFPNGYTLEQCFNEFREVAESAVNEKVQEVKDQNLIMTPGQMPGPPGQPPKGPVTLR